jgi:hypothetical protein
MKLVNKTGYLKGAKTAKNPVNIIPSNLITTQGMAFPIKANGKTLYPNTGQYKFNTPYVVETPLKQDGSSAVKSFLSAINPKNWGVTDYSKYKTRGEAYNAARKAGEKEFMWNSNRFNTNMKGTPAQQLKWSGITNDRLGIKTNRSERAYNSVKPSVYLSEKDVNQQLKNYFNSKNRFDNTEINKLRKEYIEEGNKPNYNLEKIKELEEKMFAYKPAFHGEDDPYSEDAWKIYLGMPQTKNTFSISKYKPTKSKETDINYYSLPESFKKELFELYKNKQIKEGPNNEFSFKNVFGEVSSRARVLGNFTVNKGKDDKGEYISYYDKYDLNPNLPVIGKKFGLDNFVGKPFEIYDRIYLKDFENIKQDGADELKASEAAKFSYRIKDKKRRDTQVADMYNNTLDSFRGDTTGAKRHFKSFFTHYGSERFNDVKPLEGYYGFDKKDYDDKTLDSLGREWHKKMRVPKKQEGTESAKANLFPTPTLGVQAKNIKKYVNSPAFKKQLEDKKKEDKLKLENAKRFPQRATGRVDMTASPIDAGIAAAAGIPALAGRALTSALPKVVGALNTPLTTAVPGVTAGNILGSYAAADAMVNRLPKVPGQVKRGEYGAATENVLTGGLDLLGANMLKSNPLNFTSKSKIKPNAKYSLDLNNSEPLSIRDRLKSFLSSKNSSNTATAAAKPQNTFKRTGSEDNEQLARIISHKVDLPQSIDRDDLHALIKKQLDRVDSDEYISRRMATTGETKEQIASTVKEWKDHLTDATNYNSDWDGKAYGAYSNWRKKGYLSVNSDVTNKNPEKFLDVFEHEFLHGLSPALKNEKLYKNYPILNVTPKRSIVQKVKDQFNGKQRSIDYLNEAEEQQVRSVRMNDRIRKDLGIEGQNKLSKENLDKWFDKHYNPDLEKLSKTGFKDVTDLMNFDAKARISKGAKVSSSRPDILNWLNKAWMVPAVGAAGIATQEKKQGSKNMKPLIKYKDGSKSVSLAFSRGEKDPKGGLTQKGVDKYNRATGGNLKMAVTTPPSKLKPGSKAANRRKSFCARSAGQMSKFPKAAKDPNSRLRLARKKWNC